jgi:hypothetical protein
MVVLLIPFPVLPISVPLSPLRPTCVLRETSKMGEVGHRTEALGIGFQLIETVTYLINHLIERSKSEIRACVVRALLPRPVPQG